MNPLKIINFKKRSVTIYTVFAIFSLLTGQSVETRYEKKCSGYELKIKKINAELCAFWEYIEGVIVTEGFFKGNPEESNKQIAGKDSEPDIFKILQTITGKLIVRNLDGTLKSQYFFSEENEGRIKRKHWLYQNNELVEFTSQILYSNYEKLSEDNYDHTDTWIQYYLNKPAIISSRRGPVVHTVFFKNGIQYAENFDINIWDVKNRRTIYSYEEYDGDNDYPEDLRKQIKQLQKRKNYTNIYYDIKGNIVYRYSKYNDTLKEEWLNTEGRVYKKVLGIFTGYIMGFCEGCEEIYNLHGMGTRLIQTEVYDQEVKKLQYAKTVIRESKKVERQEVYKLIDGIKFTCKARFYILGDDEYPEDSVIAQKFYCRVYRDGALVNCPGIGYDVAIEDEYDGKPPVAYCYSYGNPEHLINQYHSICYKNQNVKYSNCESCVSSDTVRVRYTKSLRYNNQSQIYYDPQQDPVISKDFTSCLYGFRNQLGTWIMEAKYDNISSLGGIMNQDQKRGMYYYALQKGVGIDLLNEELRVIYHTNDNANVKLLVNMLTERMEERIFFVLEAKDSIVLLDQNGKLLYKNNQIKGRDIKIFENTAYLSIHDTAAREGKIINLFSGKQFTVQGNNLRYYQFLYFSSGNVLYYLFEEGVQPVTEFDEVMFSRYNVSVQKKDTLIIIKPDLYAGYFALEKIPMDNALKWGLRIDKTPDNTYREKLKPGDPYLLCRQPYVKYSYRGKWGVIISYAPVVVQPPVWDSITEEGIAFGQGKRYFLTGGFSDTLGINDSKLTYFGYTSYSQQYGFYTLNNKTGLTDIYNNDRKKINNNGATYCGFFRNRTLYRTDELWGEPVYQERDSLRFILSSYYFNKGYSGVFKSITDDKYYIVFNGKLIEKPYDKISIPDEFPVINPLIKTWSYYYIADFNNEEYYVSRSGGVVSKNPMGIYNAEIGGRNYGMDKQWRIYEYNCNSIYYFPDTFTRISVTGDPNLFIVNTSKKHKYHNNEKYNSYERLFSRPLNKVYPYPAIGIKKLKKNYLLEDPEHFKHLADPNLNCLIKPDSWKSIQEFGRYFICEKEGGQVYAFDLSGIPKKLKGEGNAIVSFGYLCIFKKDHIAFYDSALKLLGDGYNYLIPQIKNLAINGIPFSKVSRMNIRGESNDAYHGKELDLTQLASLSEKQKLLYKVLQFGYRYAQQGDYVSIDQFPKESDYFDKRYGVYKYKSYGYTKPKEVVKQKTVSKPNVLPANHIGLAMKPLFNRLEDHIYYPIDKEIIFCKGDIIGLVDRENSWHKGDKIKHFVIKDSGVFLFDLYDMVSEDKRDTFVSILRRKTRDFIISQGQTCSNEMKEYDFEYYNKKFSINYDNLRIIIQGWGNANSVDIPLIYLVSMLNAPFRDFYR